MKDTHKIPKKNQDQSPSLKHLKQLAKMWMLKEKKLKKLWI